MKRVHVFEFADLPWFPSWIRAAMTSVIVAFGRSIGVAPALARVIARTLREQNLQRIVDLGSGSGGVMPDVLERVREEEGLEQTELRLTDLYPNAETIAALHARYPEHIRFEETPVNALDLASAPAGLKTMNNAFHHLRPAQAEQMLRSAQESRQPVLIYEMGDNNVPFAGWLLMLPVGLVIVFLMCLAFTPRVRPLTFRQLFFTYIIPIIPLFYAWDGQASFPRIYTPSDYDELISRLPETSDYRWEKGSAKSESGPKQGNYLLGVPC